MKKAVTQLRVASLQLLVGSDKSQNLLRARQAIDRASKQGCNFVVLPECFNCPYSNASFGPYSEAVPEPSSSATFDAAQSPSVAMLSQAARDNNIWLVGGSIPERSKEFIFNSSTVYNPLGQMVAKHRKVHLFDIDVPGGIRFMESETLTGGSSPTVFETPWCSVGLGICYDMRFGELAHLMAKRDGVKMLVYPGAFNTTTGPLHWELLQRARAVDNQLYVVTASPARAKGSDGYQAWGHSSIISPWGKVLATCEENEAIVVSPIDLEEVDKMRQAIPVRVQRRTDIYDTVSRL